MSIGAAQGLVCILKAEGVSWVSTYPTCNVNNALGEEGVPLLMMREERYAVAVADAFSRVTGGKQIGVCTVMGSTNPAGVQMAYGAIAQAYEDSSPLLVITDGVPAGAGNRTNYDIAASLHSITKWIGEIDRPQSVPSVMRQAFTHLRTGRRGPVLVTIPRGLGEYDDVQYPYTLVKGWRSAPDPDDVKAAVKALLAAKRPLLYVGDGVFYADAMAELRQLAELAQVPVLTTLKGKSAFPENHPLSVGVRGEVAAHALQTCAVLFAIGADLAAGVLCHPIPDAEHKTIVQCAVDEHDVNRICRCDVALIGDARLALQALINGVAAHTGSRVKPNQERMAEISAAREQFWAKYRRPMEANDKPMNPYRVFGDMMKTLDPNNSFVSPDSGTTRDQTSTVYQAIIPHGFMGWGNVSTLGFSLAAAIGAKLAYPQRQCINVTGDAGVSYMLGNF